MRFVRYSANGDLLERFGTFPESRDEMFGYNTYVALSGRDIVIATSHKYEMLVFGTGRGLRQIIRRVVEPKSVTRGDIEALRRQWMEGLSGNQLKEQERRFAEIRFASSKPVLEAIQIDQVGNVWVREPEPPGTDDQNWGVFDKLGRWLGTVSFGKGLRVEYIGMDYVLGVERDSMHVEYVRLYRLNK